LHDIHDKFFVAASSDAAKPHLFFHHAYQVYPILSCFLTEKITPEIRGKEKGAVFEDLRPRKGRR